MSSHRIPPPARASRRLGAVLLFALSGCASVVTPSAVAAGAADAARQAAEHSPQCKAIGDFYWEIGDGRGVRASGQVGSDYSRNSSMKIASASKWVFGAYVVQRDGGAPGEDQLQALEMRSGFTLFNPVKCLLSRSVESCMDAGENGVQDKATVGRFAYGGGHSQRLAMQLGMGRMNAAEFTAEIRSKLGRDLGFAYDKPQPAGGMVSTPGQYAQFLQKIINGQLLMHDYLGYKPVCTLPRVCATAVSSPAKEAWHYSVNHWVEDDPQTGDGSFSSPGLLGFYPWISADKTTYGIVAREKLGMKSYWQSVECGRTIRHAYMTAR